MFLCKVWCTGTSAPQRGSVTLCERLQKVLHRSLPRNYFFQRPLCKTPPPLRLGFLRPGPLQDWAKRLLALNLVSGCRGFILSARINIGFLCLWLGMTTFQHRKSNETHPLWVWTKMNNPSWLFLNGNVYLPVSDREAQIWSSEYSDVHAEAYPQKPWAFVLSAKLKLMFHYCTFGQIRC